MGLVAVLEAVTTSSGPPPAKLVSRNASTTLNPAPSVPKPSMAMTSHISSLDLRSSSFPRSQMQHLERLLRHDQLVRLDLGMTFLGGTVADLTPAFGWAKNLVALNLRLCGLQDTHGLLVARALDESISLTDVDLASNELTDSFGLALCKVLRSNYILNKVDLTRNYLTSTFAEELLLVLDKNVALCSVGDMNDHHLAF